MPEGPEIHREAARIRRALVGRRAGEVWFAFPRLQRHAGRLRGRTVREVEARGKAILVHFEGSARERRILYSHNLLYGCWMVARAGTRPPTRRSLRVAIENGAHAALLYSASEIDLLTPARVERHPYLVALGPDPLRTGTTVRTLEARLREARFARRTLAALLLDQGFVAGIGNYLRAEILFVAGLHPLQKPGELSTAERKRLARALRALPRRAARTAGVTLAPEDVPAAPAPSAGRRRRRRPRHYVHARAGRPCRRCGTKVARHEIAGRRLFLCPTCQPAAPAPDARPAGRAG